MREFGRAPAIQVPENSAVGRGILRMYSVRLSSLISRAHGHSQCAYGLVRGLASKAKQVNLTVDGNKVQVPEGTPLVTAVKKITHIPSLCFHPDMPKSGGICRICLVEDNSRPGVPIVSCKTPATDGMDINTRGAEIRHYRQANTAMLFNDHPSMCLACPANQNCEAQELAGSLNMGVVSHGEVLAKGKKQYSTNDMSSVIERRGDLCINCDRCINTCKDLQGIGVFGYFDSIGHAVDSFASSLMVNTECIQCGQCIDRCPTGALSERNEVEQVLEAIGDSSKYVLFQTAPAVRVAISEEFGIPAGEKILKNEIVTALKLLGKNVYVIDTDFTADLTILEEGNELISRLDANLNPKSSHSHHGSTELPMFTSCCPAWTQYIEKFYPEFLDNVSSAKSPQQMAGALGKSYWATEVMKVDPKDVVTVSIMPCAAKKYEKDRPELEVDGVRDVDYVLTTRELGRLLKQNSIDLPSLPKTDFDSPMGISSGAAVIFGATGGVMEAALRTAYEVVSGEEVPFKNLNIEAVRGMEGLREANISIPKTKKGFEFLKGAELKCAVAHGTTNVKTIMEVLKDCKQKGQPYPWDFIEFMACPGGCIGGGGQPKPTDVETRQARTDLIYKEDMDLPIRKSHENPDVVKVYKEFLKEPLSAISHKYLHTHYMPRKIDYANFIDMSDGSAVKNNLVDLGFENGRRDLLIEMMLAEADRTGHLSDAACVEIGKLCGIPPVEVESIASSYHVFHREQTGESIAYLCTCHNCRMKGAMELRNHLRKELNIPAGSNLSADGKYSLLNVDWLGWCVNGAPSMMVKRRGTDFLNVATDLPLDMPVSMLDTLDLLMPEDRIQYSPLTRFDPNLPSYLSPLPLADIAEAGLQMGPNKLLSELAISGLQGRGGAGFPTATKWNSAKSSKVDVKYVVCNADEGLPSTFKDWTLLKEPHNRLKVLTGMALCAKTIGAKKAYLYLRYEYRNLRKDIRSSVDELKEICPSFSDIDFEVRLGAGPYVAGEETAQFESIEGRGARPRTDRSAFPTERGLFGKPTVINNVETFASVPHIVHMGGKHWGDVGLNGQKGLKALTFTGDIAQPHYIEAPLGTPLNKLFEEFSLTNIAAAEVGGATEKILSQAEFDNPIGFGPGYLNAVGSVVLFDKTRDIMNIYGNKMEFLASESCKQCVPCRDGTRMFECAVREHSQGLRSIPGDKGLLLAADSTKNTSICAHGKAAGALFETIHEHASQTSAKS